MLAALCAPLLMCAMSSDLPLIDLKLGSYGTWTATGNAFIDGPAPRMSFEALQIQNAAGEFVISSERLGDAPQGRLRSPEFAIERDYISFRIGGGDYERHCCIDLMVDGKIVKSETGRNNDHLTPTAWDVRPWKGKSATIEIVDEASRDWGHINIDRLIQTDTPEVPPLAVGTLYQEALRPQFHFTARQWTMARLEPGMRQEGWLNDLNGLIYENGEYHLFAQRWNKCWIHAVSKDLIHWTELEPAFWEEALDTAVQSGTCVIDTHNTSGLGTPGHSPMVAFWSRNDNRNHCISYSLDHGRTWTHYAGNPVLTFPERDPKVFWYEPTHRWVMIMYGDDKYHLFTSSNLLDWTNEHSTIDDSFECPDFFEMPIEGSNQKKWVLIRGNGDYSVGTFDGHRFVEEQSKLPGDIGPNFYATQSWENAPGGRRVQAAWVQLSNFPNMPFSQMVSFPCELTLHSTTAGFRLHREPVREIASVLGEAQEWPVLSLVPGQSKTLVEHAGGVRLTADVDLSGHLELSFGGEKVVVGSTEIQSGSAKAEVDAVRHLEILFDRTSIEIFVNHGVVSSTRFVLPKGSGVSVEAIGGAVTLKNLKVSHVNSIWCD